MSSPYTFPSTASLPKKMPHSEMITTSSGAIEKMVAYASDPLSLVTLSSPKPLNEFFNTSQIPFRLIFVAITPLLGNTAKLQPNTIYNGKMNNGFRLLQLY